MSAYRFAALCGLSLLAAAPAAAVSLLYQGTDDLAYEGAEGWLATTYGLSVLPGNNANVVLPQLERAVGEVRIGRANNSERTRAIHAPTVGSGLPAPAGGGVANALTNYDPQASTNTAFVSGQPVGFSLSRVGNVVTYTVGAFSGSVANDWNLGVDAFQIRTRGGNAGASMKVLGLTYTPAGGAVRALGDWSSADGNVRIALFGGVDGDFTVSGSYEMSWLSGSRPGASALASQIKLLDLPELTAAVPEPATWAMMILGFGAVGFASRRRQAIAMVVA